MDLACWLGEGAEWKFLPQWRVVVSLSQMRGKAARKEMEDGGRDWRKAEQEEKMGLFGKLPLFPSLAASPQKTCLQLFLGSSSWFVGRILTRHFPDINPRLVFNLGKIISQISVRPSGDLNLIGDAGQFQIGQKLDAQAVSKEFSGAAKNVKLEYLRVTAQASTIIRRFLFQLKNFSFPWTISRCGCFDTWQMLQCTILHCIAADLWHCTADLSFHSNALHSIKPYCYSSEMASATKTTFIPNLLQIYCKCIQNNIPLPLSTASQCTVPC